MEEKKVKVKEWNIHCIKFGHGPNKLLYLCGGYGDGISLKPVMETFDPDKFTVITWDPPGYGMSRPPNRVLSDRFYEEDAEYAYEFMKALDIPRYSVLGYCGGGRVAMILAAQHPDQVESLMLTNASSFILPSEVEKQMKFTDIQRWPLNSRDKIMKLYNYSEEEIQTLVTNRWKALFDMYKKRNNDICNEILHLIQCRTLIISGTKDPLVDNSHATYLSSKIKNSSVHVYPEGGHLIHFKYTKDFTERVMRHILESP